MSKIYAFRLIRQGESIDVISAHASLDFGEPSRDLLSFRHADFEQFLFQAIARNAFFKSVETAPLSVCEDSCNRPNVIPHGAVPNRASAAAIIARHAADRGLRGR